MLLQNGSLIKSFHRLQALPIPTVQLMTASSSSTPRLTSIPVVTNLPSEQPRHAGILILPGGRSVSVQSVNTENVDNVKGGAQLTLNTNTQDGKKELFYLSPDSTGKLQFLPMVQSDSQVQYASPNSEKRSSGKLSYDTQTVHDNTVVRSNVEVSDNVNSERHIQYCNFSEAHVKASQNSIEKDRNSTYLAQESHISDNIGGETSNDALELSRNLDQHSNYLAAHVGSHEIVPANTEVTKNMDISSSTRFKTGSVTMQTSDEVGTALEALVNIVKCNSMAQQNNDDLQQSSGIGDKENNLISAGKTFFT